MYTCFFWKTILFYMYILTKKSVMRNSPCLRKFQLKGEFLINISIAIKRTKIRLKSWYLHTRIFITYFVILVQFSVISDGNVQYSQLWYTITKICQSNKKSLIFETYMIQPIDWTYLNYKQNRNDLKSNRCDMHEYDV